MAVETTYLSGWALWSWMSPGAAFFLFVNVLIGAIVVTSRGHHHQGGRAAATRRLCRSASSMVFDRLRSFSIFSAHPVAPMEMEEYNYSISSPELELEVEAEELEQQHQPAAVAAPARSPVAAAVAAAHAPADGGASSEIAMAEAAEAGRDMSAASSDDEAAAHGLALQGHGRQQSPSGDVVVVAADEATAAAVESQEEKLAEATMKPRAPARRREAEEEAPEGKAALNARAESFIRRFREDLKLERLNSIINYTRTLRRGAGIPSPTAQ